MSNYNYWKSEWDAVTSTDELFDSPVPQNGGSGGVKTGSVLILYGLGADLGNFEIFAMALKKNLSLNYNDKNIEIQKSINRNELIDALLNTTLTEIKELHIFSHAFGGGLAIGYHDQALNNERLKLITTNPTYTYDDVVLHEIGCLLTDHLDYYLSTERSIIQKNLKDLDFVKIWGCNSGVSDWVYGGEYWEKLNDKNTPKPAFAKSFASYTNKSVFGATSGSHIEYKIKGNWISGYDYPKKYGKKYPSTKEYTDIRLHPDQGTYNKYLP